MGGQLQSEAQNRHRNLLDKQWQQEIWQWEYGDDGNNTWTVWDEDGKVVVQSKWRNKKLLRYRLDNQ